MASPLRILHVVVNMNRGGAETLIMNLYRNIDRTKVQFDFLTCKEGVFDQEILAMGGNIHRIPHISEVGHVRYKTSLTNFFLEHAEYKVVHSHMDKMSGLVLQAAKQASIPIRIAHSHSTKSEGGFLAKCFKSYVGIQVKRNATHYYACSHKAAKWLYGSRAKDTVILKNGIEADKFIFANTIRYKIRNDLGIMDNTLVLGHVGRFSKPKNHLFLLEVFAHVHKQIPNSILILVGDGPLQDIIKAKINALGLGNNVILLGIREDVDQILQAFDLFLFPSLYEGLPVTLVEAQGAGLPCIISNKITREVDLGFGLIQTLPISNVNQWVSTIINYSNRDLSRSISKKRLAFRGYDIKRTAQIAQNSYLNLGEKVL